MSIVPEIGFFAGFVLLGGPITRWAVWCLICLLDGPEVASNREIYTITTHWLHESPMVGGLSAFDIINLVAGLIGGLICLGLTVN